MTFPIKSVYRHSVEDGVPISEPRNGRRIGEANWSYPFAIMKINQSFFVPMNEIGVNGITKISCSITLAEKRNRPARYIWRIRYPDMHDEDGVRVWRIADDDGRTMKLGARRVAD